MLFMTRATLTASTRAFSSRLVSALKMIGDPDVVLGSPKACGRTLALEASRERIEMLREDPEMADWDFELKAKLLIVEGNIGVGKTTLTKKLAEKLDYRIFLEPTTENPYLGKLRAKAKLLL